jgi:hypothetical protein
MTLDLVFMIASDTGGLAIRAALCATLMQMFI